MPFLAREIQRISALVGRDDCIESRIQVNYISIMVATIDWSFWFGLALTVFTAWLGIYFTIRKKYPGKIVFFQERSIRLFDDIVRNLPDLVIQYKNLPIQQNLVVLRGYVFNAGTKDIGPDMVDTPLQAVLPEGSKWLEASITPSNGGKATAKIMDERTVEFSLGLFRCEEYLRLEALIAQPHGGKRAKISFSHRISDTAAVELGHIPSKKSSTWSFDMVSILIMPTSFLISLATHYFNPKLVSVDTLKGLGFFATIIALLGVPLLFVIPKRRKLRKLLNVID